MRTPEQFSFSPGGGDPRVAPCVRQTVLGPRALEPFVWVDAVPVFGQDGSDEVFAPPADAELDENALPPSDCVLVLETNAERVAAACVARRARREGLVDFSLVAALLGTNPKTWWRTALRVFRTADRARLGRPVGVSGESADAVFPALGHRVTLLRDPRGLLAEFARSRGVEVQRTLALWRCRDRAHLVGVSCGGPWAAQVATLADGQWQTTSGTSSVSPADEPAEQLAPDLTRDRDFNLDESEDDDV